MSASPGRKIIILCGVTAVAFGSLTGEPEELDAKDAVL